MKSVFEHAIDKAQSAGYSMIKQLLMVSFYVLLTTVLLMYLFQRQFIYAPSQERPDRKIFHAEDMNELSLHTTDGINLNAWYKPASSNKPTILYLHGNAGHIGYRMPLARQLIAAGFGVLLLEYRGYGGNQGRPTEEGLYRDARAAMQFLQENHIFSHHLVLYGESLGSGVATKMATEFPACAMVLQSPFTSLAAVARSYYPWMLIGPVDKYDSLSRIAEINIPLLIIHGDKDKVVPFVQGVTLYTQANNPKQFIPLKNKGHNNLWDEQFSSEVIHFIQSYCANL